MRQSRLVSLFAVVVVTPWLSAQSKGSAVIPKLETVGGFANTGSSYPWNRKTSSIRIQYIYDASELPAYPVTITGVRFRPYDLAATSRSWTGGTYGDVTIQMSTAAVAWNKLTSSFAGNHGQDKSTVFSGSVALTAGSGTGWGVPSKPYVSIKLAKAFPYDPAKGPLLIDIGSDGSKYTGGTTTTNAITTGTHRASRMYNLSSPTATTGTVQQDLGMVMEIDYTIAGTHPHFEADRTAVATGGKVQFTDKSATASTTGILNYAWDLDGDSKTDSTARNPSFTYPKPGKYDVKLSVVSAHGGFAKTVNGMIEVANPVATAADLIQYQFNETRDPVVANSATGTKAPAQGTVTGTAWQGDAQGPAFGPNEKGFGVMMHAGTANLNYVASGHNLNETGSITFAWWQRLKPAPARNSFAYTFGPTSGSSLRCFNSGDAGDSVMIRGIAALGHFNARKVVRRVNTWVHICLVIDDTAGVARWYIDGAPTAEKSFTPGAFSESSLNFQVGKRTTSSATHANFYSMDDFRIYTRALSVAEVLGLQSGEAASTGNFGSSCVSSGTAPKMSGAGGRPALGNAGFRAVMTGAPANAPSAVVLGIAAHAGGSLPIDISAVLGSGCKLETQIFLLILAKASATGSASLALPVPNDSKLIGLHAYVQGAFDSGTARGTTDLLDINIQK